MEVIVSFIKKVGFDESFIMTMGIDVYPTYKAGDKIFLQITNSDDHNKDVKLTEYKITDVVHSVREHKSINYRNQENPLGLKYFMGMEVYVREVA